MVTVQNIRTTLTQLRQVCRRAERQALEASDWPMVNAVLSKERTRAERRLAKMLASVAKAQESEREETGPNLDVEDTVADAEDDRAGTEKTGENGGAAGGDSSSSSSERAEDSTSAEPRKGHGRNGAGAYAHAKHFVHALLAGVLGTLCEACVNGSHVALSG